MKLYICIKLTEHKLCRSLSQYFNFVCLSRPVFYNFFHLYFICLSYYITMYNYFYTYEYFDFMTFEITPEATPRSSLIWVTVKLTLSFLPGSLS